MTTIPTAAVAAAIEHLRADKRLWPLIRRRVYLAAPEDPVFPFVTVERAADGALRVTVLSDFGDEREVRWLVPALRESLEDGPFRVIFADTFRAAFSPKRFLGVLRVRLRPRAAARSGSRPPAPARDPATAGTAA